MTDEERKKWYRRAAIAGIVIGLLCHCLPPEYRAACETVSRICTGG
jgi:hypothetical protein